MSASDRRVDARLLLPAAAGWMAAIVLVAQRPLVGFLAGAAGVVALVGLLVILRQRRARASGRFRGLAITSLGLAAVTTAMAFASALHVQTLISGPVGELAAAEAVVEVRLTIDGDPALRTSPGDRRPPYVVARATIEEVTGRGRTTRVSTPVLVVGSPGWQRVRFGQRIKAVGRLGPVEAGSDVAAVLSARASPTALDEPAWWLRAAEQVRAGLRESVQSEPEAVRGLVPALVMGDESGLPAGLAEDFKTTGLTHLSAVSGTNLTLLLAFVLPLARLLGVRARGLTAVGLAMVVVFVVLARPQPSVLRAAAMGLVALAAMTSGGRRRGVRSLSAAVLALLLLDTSLARSAGFALSVLATAGIVLLGPGWRDALATWLPVRVAEAIACPLAAQIACTPVVAWLSGQMSMIAVVANLLAGPAVGPATILGFGAAGIALLSADLAQLVGWMAGWPARWIITVATEGAQLPGAANAWPATVTGITVLTVLCVALVVGLHRMLARPIAMVLAVVLLAAVVLRPVGSIGWPPDDWVLVACDVGQGDGLVLRAGPGTAVVVDTGPEPDAIDRCLRELDVQYVPVLVLTHFHADHVGGLAGVLRGRRVGEIEVSPYSSPPAEYRRVVQLAASQGILVRNVSYHERRMVGQVTWTALWPARVPALPTSAGGPSGSAGDEGSPENNASIAMMAEVAGLRLLLTGDLEPEAQRAVVASGVDLRADVLKVAHHGSGQQDPAFVAATGARLAVISVGVDNDYGHPAPRTLDLLTRAGMGVGRTDTGGSVAVVNTDGRLAVAAEGRRQ
jgi:competence protein ComEC